MVSGNSGIARSVSATSISSPRIEAAQSSSHPPYLFICSISQEVMDDPVVCSDGHTYNRSSALEWLRTNNGSAKSPNTGQPDFRILVDNVGLRCAIFEAYPSRQDTYRQATAARAASPASGAALTAPSPRAASPAYRPGLAPREEIVRLSETYADFAAGDYVIGSPASFVREWGDLPKQTVHLTRGFAAQCTLVTQAQWFARMGNNPSWFCEDSHGERASERPANVSWFDGAAYMNEASREAGYTLVYDLRMMSGAPGVGLYHCPQGVIPVDETADGYRYLWEAEWEIAATSEYPTTHREFTEAQLRAIAWYIGNAHNRTHPVGQLQANARGMYDLLGNVYEWTGDYWSRTAANSSRFWPLGGWRENIVVDPHGPSAGVARVRRGGSYCSPIHFVRLAFRNGDAPATRIDDLGFRPSRSLND